MTGFNGKTVLVTGGTRGVGRAIADAYLAAGASVWTCGRNNPDNESAAQFISADIRDPEQVATLIADIATKDGRFDILINNAGGSPPADAATASPRFSESIIKLNLIAPLNLAQAAHQHMTDGGAIVNIASVSGMRPSPGTAAYGAAKAGLLNLTQSLGMEWAPKVRVNAIIAGLIKTPAAHDHYAGDEGIRKIEAALPMKRMATPEDIAQACLFLTSDQASYISGASLEVHGGGEPPSFLNIAAEAHKS
ncbi:MAG: SDR family oxidoreductase [Alphaproteobacteria bacterium]